MADDIEVQYDPKHQLLSVSCRDEAFARLRDAVIAEARIAERIDGPADGIHVIQIMEAPVAPLTGRYGTDYGIG